MHDLIIIGAGPGGIALAAEAFASGIEPSQILILEKGPTHNSAIRQLYPEKKLTTANYKGFAARCRSEEHTSELQSHLNLVCRLLLEKKKKHWREGDLPFVPARLIWLHFRGKLPRRNLTVLIIRSLLYSV